MDNTLPIVLVSVGAVLFAAAIAVTIFLVWQRQRRRDYQQIDGEGSIAEVIARSVSQPTDVVKVDPDAETLNARMYLRGKQMYRLVRPCFGIGCRVQKSTFVVAHVTPGHPELIMSMTRRSLDCSYVLQESNKSAFISVLRAFTEKTHPFVMPVEDVDFLHDRGVAVVLRRNVARGSLRDKLYGVTNPMQSFARKYIHGRVQEPGEVAQYGRQILEGMLFLTKCGIPLGHIHSGNILLDGGVARITDWENTLLGLPTQAPRKLTDSDLLQFGALLYEMATGSPLCGPPVLEICPPPVRDLLQSIFDPEPLEPVTLESLRNAPLFSGVVLRGLENVRVPDLAHEDVRKLLYSSGLDRGPAGKKARSAAKKRSASKARQDLGSSGSGVAIKGAAAAAAPASVASSAPSGVSYMSAAKPAAAAAAAPAVRKSSGIPPPPPPPASLGVPAPSEDRNALLASIRNPAARSLKHVEE